MIQKFFNGSIILSLLLGSVLPVMAASKNVNGTGGKNDVKTSVKDDTKMSAKKLDIACMAAAVDKRETAILSGFDVFAAAVKNALGARKDALKTAWGNTDAKARKDAINKAWKTYGTAASKARKDWKSAVHTAWEQFRKDRNACGPGAATADSATEALDNDVK